MKARREIEGQLCKSPDLYGNDRITAYFLDPTRLAIFENELEGHDGSDDSLSTIETKLVGEDLQGLDDDN